MNGEKVVPMLPWWRGFKGEINAVDKYKYDVTGIVKKIDDTTLEITELPINKWTGNYKAELESMMAREKGETGVIKVKLPRPELSFPLYQRLSSYDQEYREHHTNDDIHFTVTMDASQLQKAEEKGLHEFFKLTTKISTSNMICFDFNGKIKKYDSAEEILADFYPVRLAYYERRKASHSSNSSLMRLTSSLPRMRWLTSFEMSPRDCPIKLVLYR